MNDVTSRLGPLTHWLGDRFAKISRSLGEAAAALLAPGPEAATAYPHPKAGQPAPANLALLLFAAAAIGALAALITDIGFASLYSPSAVIAKLDAHVSALDQRVAQTEREEGTLMSRVAAAESAIAKSTAGATTAIAQIQKALAAQPAPQGLPPSGLPVLQHLEERVATLEKITAPQLALAAAEPAPTHAESGIAESGHGENTFPPFDAANFGPMLIWLALTFGALYLLMAKIALPRVEGILENRAHKIATDITEANHLRAQSEEAAAAHDKLIADAKAKALALAQETHAKLHRETEAKRAALEAELNTKLAASETQIHDMKAKAMSHVDSIATETAAAIVQHITGKPADQSAVAQAVATAKA